MRLQVTPLALVVFYFLIYYGRVHGDISGNLSKSNDLAEDIGPSKLAIKIDDGDQYDCIDLYKQPAFDHPLLNNHTANDQLIHTQLPNQARTNSTKDDKFLAIDLRRDNCPIGTIPIKRLSEEDLLARNPRFRRPPICHAITRTTEGPKKYFGAAGRITTHSPKVVAPQYTSTRIKLQNGPDSIEVGWRVDPTMYKDTLPRFYIRTDAGNTHCFDLDCPGFMLLYQIPVLGTIIRDISKPGGPVYEISISISKDRVGNWYLRLLPDYSVVIGYWPSHLFTQLNEFASYIEWGGEAYSPSGMSPLPQMGSGSRLQRPHGRPLYDASIRFISEIDDHYSTNDANDAKGYRDSDYYFADDVGYVNETYKHLFFYGGNGGII